jgi:hypothetical protein
MDAAGASRIVGQPEMSRPVSAAKSRKSSRTTSAISARSPSVGVEGKVAAGGLYRERRDTTKGRDAGKRGDMIVPHVF